MRFRGILPGRKIDHSGQQSRQAVGKHLPWRPRPLAKVKVADKQAHGPAQEPRPAAKGCTGQDNQRRHRLEEGHGGKDHPPRHRHRAQDRQQHQLLRRRLFPLKGEEKGAHSPRQHNQADQIVVFRRPVPAQHHQQHRRSHQKQAGTPLLPSHLFPLHRAITSSFVTASGNTARLIRAAAVV